MKDNVSVTVGIPIYNEEKNIERLLCSLALQDIKIENTILVNDGSTDRTSEVLGKIKNDIKNRLNVCIIDLKENKGKANALNLIFKNAQSDYLVLLDSDVYFPRSGILKRLLECFKVNNNVGLACGWYKIEVLKPFDIVGRAYRFSSNILEKVAQTSNNMYGATGAIMVLPKNVYKNLALPENIVRVDAYIYLYVLSLGKQFAFCSEAKVTMPLYDKGNFRKFIQRQVRVKSVPKQHLETFYKLAEQKFEEPNLKILLKAFVNSFFKRPADGSIWVATMLISYFYRKFFASINAPYTWRKAGF